MCICVYLKKGHWLTAPPTPALSSLRSERVLAVAHQAVSLSNTPLIYNLCSPSAQENRWRRGWSKEWGMHFQPYRLKKIWQTLVLVPPLTAVGRVFREATATITLLKPKHLHSISVEEVWCVCVLHTDPCLEPTGNPYWGLRAVCSWSEYCFWGNICFVYVRNGKRLNWAEIISCEASVQSPWAQTEKTTLFCSND